MTLCRLVDRSEVVLMDLRRFSPRNAGCIFENQHLNRCDAGRPCRVCHRQHNRRIVFPSDDPERMEPDTAWFFQPPIRLADASFDAA